MYDNFQQLYLAYLIYKSVLPSKALAISKPRTAKKRAEKRWREYTAIFACFSAMIVFDWVGMAMWAFGRSRSGDSALTGMRIGETVQGYHLVFITMAFIALKR